MSLLIKNVNNFCIIKNKKFYFELSHYCSKQEMILQLSNGIKQ